MKYVDFCGNKVSALAIGTGNANGDTIVSAINDAYSRGINYIDTAYSYGNYHTEEYVGEWLSYVNRKSVYIATKRNINDTIWEDVNTAVSAIRDQCSRLCTGYIDYFLFHGINAPDVLNKVNIWWIPNIIKCLDTLKERGIIRKVGFSYHGNGSDLEAVLKLYDWDFVQVRRSLLDELYWNDVYFQDKTAYQVAMEHKKSHPGFGVILMEAFDKGLAFNLKFRQEKFPSSQRVILERFLRDENPILFGFITTRQENQCINLYETTVANKENISKEEYDNLYSEIERFVDENAYGPCINCYSCDCQKKYNIWYILKLYNEQILQGSHDLQNFHKRLPIIDCGNCHDCDNACEMIDIREFINLYNNNLL